MTAEQDRRILKLIKEEARLRMEIEVLRREIAFMKGVARSIRNVAAEIDARVGEES